MARRRHRRRRRYGGFITMPGFTGLSSGVGGAMKAVKSNLPAIVGGGAGVVVGTIVLKQILALTGLGAKLPVALARFYPLLGGLLGGIVISLGATKFMKKPALGRAALAGSVIAGGATVLVGYLWDLAPLRKYADFVTIPTMADYGGVIVDNYITGNPGYNDYGGVIVDNQTQQQQLAELSAMAMGDLGNEDMMERLAP